MEWLPWAGNIGIVVGLYLVGGRVRVGQLALAAGALAWGTTGVLHGDWALASLNLVTSSLSIRGYYKWGTTSPSLPIVVTAELDSTPTSKATRVVLSTAPSISVEEWDDPPGLRGPSLTSLDRED